MYTKPKFEIHQNGHWIMVEMLEINRVVIGLGIGSEKKVQHPNPSPSSMPFVEKDLGIRI